LHTDTIAVPVDSISIEIDPDGRVVLDFFGGQKWPLKMAFPDDDTAEEFATALEQAGGPAKIGLTRGFVQLRGFVDGSVTVRCRTELGIPQPGWPPGGFRIPAEGTKPAAREIRQRVAMRR
jgi:hypothetical protein